jgi:ubiquinone/menaquinone biosynthesis C-methylase UbiE
MPSTTLPSPARIMGAATQYWSSALLLGAFKLDLFSLIPPEGADLDELAGLGGFSKHRLETLLHALVSHEFLEKREGRFFNARDVELFLRKGAPGYLGGALGFAIDLYEPWGRIDACLRENKPVAGERHLHPGSVEMARFVRAMHERALALGPKILGECDFSGMKSLLDLGGGPGTLAHGLTRRFPGLRATVLDLPPVAEEARRILTEQGAGDEIRVVGGSYLEDLDKQLGGERYDAVLLSGQMHQERLEDCRHILAQSRKVLKDGGRLFLVDIMVEEDKTSPRFATLFGMNMALMRPNGCVHSREEMADCLSQAGFKVARSGTVPLDYPYFYFLADKV